MSELAFDGNGEPISFPAEAEELRVRRFRNPGMRGACEVVHDRAGSPLYVPIDATYVEFRAMVDGAPGRYRLDPVDSGRRVIGGSAPAYVTLSEGPRNSSGGGIDDRDVVIRELVRANADMTKTIADRFANVMEAAAGLLRAADGAGLPRREPAAPPTVVEVEDDDDDEEEEEEAQPDVAALIAQILPTIQMWLATKAAEKPAASPPAAAPVSAPASVPAPALAATPVPAVGENGAAAGAGVAPMSSAPTPVSAPAETPSVAGDGVRNAMVAPSPAQTAHLFGIYARLTPEEQRVAQLAVTRMSAEVRSEWLAELTAVSVERGVELVRSMIPTGRGRKGGVS